MRGAKGPGRERPPPGEARKTEGFEEVSWKSPSTPSAPSSFHETNSSLRPSPAKGQRGPREAHTDTRMRRGKRTRFPAPPNTEAGC